MGVKIFNVGINSVRFGEVQGGLKQISFDASRIQSLNSPEDYIRGVDSVGTASIYNIGNVSVDDTFFYPGSDKSLKINGNTFIDFPVGDHRWTNRKVYLKSRIYTTNNDNIIYFYFVPPTEHTVTYDFNDRLMFGSTDMLDQQLTLWNNQQNPIVFGNVDITGGWKEIELYYNGVDTVTTWLDGVQVYQETYTIQQYSQRRNYFSIYVESGTWLDYFEMQLEGINWNSPTLPN